MRRRVATFFSFRRQAEKEAEKERAIACAVQRPTANSQQPAENGYRKITSVSKVQSLKIPWSNNLVRQKAAHESCSRPGNTANLFQVTEVRSIPVSVLLLPFPALAGLPRVTGQGQVKPDLQTPLTPHSSTRRDHLNDQSSIQFRSHSQSHFKTRFTN